MTFGVFRTGQSDFGTTAARCERLCEGNQSSEVSISLSFEVIRLPRIPLIYRIGPLPACYIDTTLWLVCPSPQEVSYQLLS
jgi:hypothetical protein